MSERTAVLSVCTGDYGEAFEKLVPSWVGKGGDVIVYTDKPYSVVGVEIRDTLSTPENWIDAVGCKAKVVQEFIKEDKYDRILFTDMDCYIRQGFEEIWNHDFDIAVSSKAHAKADSIACGTYFARNNSAFKRFVGEWVELQEEYKELGVGVQPRKQAYDQYSFTALLYRDWLKVHYYDGKIYNNRRMLYNSVSEWQKGALNAKIIHFAGDYWRNVKGEPVLEKLAKEEKWVEPKFKLITWLWHQNKTNHKYTGADVNRLYEQAKKYITIPFSFACVTDTPDGISPEIEIIPLPHELDYLSSNTWDAKKGKPQCYRRLALFAPDAEKRFGSKKIVSIDLDASIFGNIDNLFDRDEDIVLLASEQTDKSGRPYNGSLLMIKAGSRPRVWEELSLEGVLKAGKKYPGSDQSWISYILGDGEATWSAKDGVCMTTPGAFERGKWKPSDGNLVFWLGFGNKPMEKAASMAGKSDTVSQIIAKFNINRGLDPKLNIMTWLWQQEKSGFKYSAQDVNRWAESIRYNTNMAHTISCVTDIPDGIDKGINIIPMPSDFTNISNDKWAKSRGRPQCYRRLAMFHKDAERLFGKKFVSMDLDCTVVQELDPLFLREEDFVIVKGLTSQRPYNGSMMMVTAGVNHRVYDRFTPGRAIEASTKYTGSDQAFIAYCMGLCEAVWTEEDGVYLEQSTGKSKKHNPSNCRIIFYPGGGGRKSPDLFQKTTKLVDGRKLVGIVFDDINISIGMKLMESLGDEYNVRLLKKPSPFVSLELDEYDLVYFFDHRWIRPYYDKRKICCGVWAEGPVSFGKLDGCKALHYEQGADADSALVEKRVLLDSRTNIQDIANFIRNEV